MKIYNNNPAFGHGGPFEVESATFEEAAWKLADEMRSCFEIWAAEAQERIDALHDSRYRDVDREGYICDLRAEFVAGLTQVLHCVECGQDYHADAPELGHADDCSKLVWG